MTENDARAVLLVRAFEEAGDNPQWTADDRAWATRAAQQALGEDARHERFVVERARLALQRLAPRDAHVRRALQHRLWSPITVLLALVLAIALGLATDSLVAGSYFNLLSPAYWGLIAWNLLLYVALALAALRQRRAGPWRRALGRGLQRWSRRMSRRGPLAGFAQRWAEVSGGLSAHRAAVLLHVMAAGLALGLIAGLFLRGLVFDYRAGWATTLLEPPAVRQALAVGLAPATAVLGQPLPEGAAFEALRVTPTQPASASAAPWIYTMALNLALLVVAPRILLAAVSAVQARWRAARFVLPLEAPYFQRLQPTRVPRGVWVLPHAEAPSPAAVLGLRTLLTRLWGEQLPLQVAPPLPYGDEEQPPLPPESSRPVVWVDLVATPEPDVQGRLLGALAQQGRPAMLLLADEGPFVQRFGPGDRLAQRRAAWRALADAAEVPFVAVDLSAPDAAAGETALRAALDA